MTNDEILSHLRKLGTSSIEVAHSLKKLGIRGTRGGCNCPIAIYLKTLMEADVSVFVLIDSIEIEIVDHSTEYLSPPKAIINFIDDFDNRAYPFLCAC